MVSGAGAAYANNTAQITISNTWTSQANYSASLSSCAGSATPAFANLNASQSRAHSVTASQPRVFSCSVYYSKGGGSCRYVVSRLTTQNVNPVTGVVTYTWNYPQVNVTKSGSADCLYTFTSVSDTNAVVTATNGSFSVTLTLDE
jgi:hypothetical protein